MVVLIVVVGKAFCAWGCPIPWLQRFFRPKRKASDGKTPRGGQKGAKCEALSSESGENEKKNAQSEGFCVEKSASSEAPARISPDSVHGGGFSLKDGAVGCACEPAAAESDAEQGGLCGCGPFSACGDACATEAASSSCASCGHACKLAPVGGERDGAQLDTRHAVLAGTLASAAVFGFPVFCLVCPVGLTFATIVGLWHLFQFNEPSWALIAFPAILTLEVTVLRKWCSKICPISALTSLIANANRTPRPRVDPEGGLRERGVDCHACVDACPEKLDPHPKRIPKCSKCGACVEACPVRAIKIRLLK